METWELEDKVRDHVLNRDEFKDLSFEFRMSSTGACPRLMDYQVQHGRKDVEFPQAMRMMKGTFIHEMWQDIWTKSYPDSYKDAEKELYLDVEGVQIVGHTDGYFSHLDSIYELKCVSDFTYQKVVNDDCPIPSHFEQANLYASTYGASQVLMHYYNTNTAESKFFLVPLNQELFHASVKKWTERIQNKKTGKIAPRPYHDPTASPCWFCEARDWCYKDFDLKGMEHKRLEDPKLSDIAAKAWEFRTKRLKLDKAEKKSKADLSHLLLDQNLSSAIIKVKEGADLQASIKLGKNKNPIITLKEVKE